MYYPLALLVLLASAAGDGNFSFKKTHIQVEEAPFTQAVFGISRTGATTGTVDVTCKMNASAQDADVIGTSQNIQFRAGVTSGECRFTIADDEIPETNETFAIELIVTGSGIVVPPSVAYLTILANDDAFGIIGFNETGPLLVDELSSQVNTRNIKLTRKAGLIGTVQVSWKVTSGPNNGLNDFISNSGVVDFSDGQSMANLAIKVKPDNVAENEESFTLTLESASGGATLEPSAKQIIVKIPANDAPLQFTLDHFTVPENQTSVEVEVSRGLGADGVTEIGPVNEITTVDWYLASGSAMAGKDYHDDKGTLTFQSGETKKMITIRLINDEVPEQAENFTVHLVNASQNAYIKPPGMATVVLSPNDDQHGVIAFGQHPSILDEDMTGTFYVNRSAGTFGDVTVSWKILGSDASSVFETTSGELRFFPGDNLLSFQVTVSPDSIPEESKEYNIQLYNVTGGARLHNTLSAQRANFFVRDSDDVYGVFEFAADSQQRINMDSEPRKLHLNITRMGGLVGDVTVNLTVVYILPGTSNPSNEVALTYLPAISIAAGSSSVSVAVEIADDGFIKLGASFKAELTSVSLQGGASGLINSVTPSSPKIGNRSITFLNVTAKDANGEIGFSTAHQSVSVQEPVGPSSLFMQLPVRRTGTADRVVVYWNITSVSATFYANDTGPQSGKVTFEEGHDEVDITIEIKPDSTPEVAEVFTVNLVNVSDLDRLQIGASSAKVTIEESDNPGGTFQFKNNDAAISIQEGQSFNVVIERLGSALDTRWVAFRMTPSGSSEFYGSVSSQIFLPGERQRTVLVIAIDDGIPEIDETFALKLYSEGPAGQKGVLGKQITINVTIVENDDPYGVVGFKAPNIIKTIDESKLNTESASFEVFRDKGTFGAVSVFWNITADNGANPSLDVSPVSGVVNFLAGDSSKFIIIRSLPDTIPEGNKSFTVHLNNISSIAKLAVQELRKATLIVTKNDNPVYFAPPVSIQVREGHNANFTVQRGGDGSSVVDVFYKTEDGTAKSSSGDYQVKSGKVTFNVGEFQKIISVLVLNDSTPEGVETFKVILTNSTGDTVLYNETTATVSILASDKGTGEFQFASSSLNKTIEEGATVGFTVERKFAQFGVVRVYWQVVHKFANGSVTQLSPGQEFTKVADFVTFNNGLSSQSVTLTPIQDGIAELDESFEVHLINATGIQTGLDGIISSPSTAFLTITANDDPNGLLKFAERSVDIPEDFKPGMEATTTKNLTVLRDQGSWGTIRVAWEVQTAPASLARSDNAYDLFLLGSVMSGVKSVPAQRRPNTETYVFCFDGTNNESFVEVAGLTGLESKFSVRLWVNATKGKYGYLLANMAGNVVNFALALNTSGSSTIAHFFYLSNKTEVNFGKDIADNSWHFVVFTVDPVDSNEVQFYLDGDRAGNPQPIPSGSFSPGGVYHVGKGQMSEAHFTGCIQDITVYPEVLVADVVKEMAMPNKELTPVNGYLTFEPQVTERKVEISTVDDNTPEDDTPYTLVLYSPVGGARLDSTSAGFKMRLEVLKSDNANGLFGLKSISLIVVTESTNVTVTIERSEGRFGSATVFWSVFKISTSVLASDDFIMASGSVDFAESENEKVVTIPVNDDSLPEVDEHFTLNLTSVSPMDGSTATSAASLKPGFTEVNITIEESDYPNGLLQFMSDIPAANETISPSSSQFNIDTRESARTLTLHVIRAQGTLGSVKCQWKTVAGTAKSPEDFIDTTGSVEFASGARNSTINITIIDNNISELEKTFRVELFNAEGGAQLNPAAKTAYVTILPSDDAFGIISFAPDSLSRVVSEGSGSTAYLTVRRTRGLLGPSNVYWQVSGPGAHDVENTDGFVLLSEFSNTTQIAIRIKEDADPELAESFLVHLMNVSAGRLADHGTQSNITILASDDPYGVFVFSPTQHMVTENNMTVNLTIKRMLGSQGVVRVNYSSAGGNASPNDDYVPLMGAVVFNEGQKNATVSLMVLDDDKPEAAETIMVNLTNVQLVGGHPVFPAPDNSPRIGASSVVEVVIKKNDNANGIVQLSASTVRVHEPHTGSVVNVTRTAGDFGTIYVSFEVVALSANGSDYRIQSTNITLVEKQREAIVPVDIVHDLTPEFDEIFQIKLISVAGGAELGSQLECTVTILENDYPYGLIGFDNASLLKSVVERSTLSPETLTVKRRFGLRGGSRVHWEARLDGVLASADIEPVEGDLIFAQGEDVKTINFNVKPDATPEILEIIKFNLTSVIFLSEGIPSLDQATRVAKVRIEANDAPHGVVEFAQSSYNASEGSTTYLLVLRQFGTAGDIRVFYSTVEHVGGNQAVPNVDYNATTNSSIMIPSGQDSANIAISIPDDLHPELGEVFDVILEHVELVGQSSPSLPPQLGGNQRAAVTIVTSDDAHGLIVIKAVDPDVGSHGSRKTVNETENLLVHFSIERLKGTIGRVTVDVEVQQNGATINRDFIASGSTFTFNDKDNSSKSYFISIKSDNIPEADEEIIIKLVNPTGGARVAPGLGNNVTVIIQANDGVAGQVGFDEQSRSLVVKEGSQVSLIVNRTQSVGRVSVDWHVSGENASSDFVVVSGTVMFNEGDTYKTIDLTIRNDSTPETHEVFVVQLSNIQTFDIASTGQASFIPGKTTATVSISASDRPHGVVELEAGSRLVSRADEKNFTLTVSRLFGNMDAIRVYYEAVRGNITALQSDQGLASPGEDFFAGTFECSRFQATVEPLIAGPGQPRAAGPMFCATGTGKSSSSRTPRKSQESSSKTQVPLLLHFDVNKTVIQSDSVQMKGVEEGIREGIADLFWGVVHKSGGTETWEWIKAEPSCTPPKDDILAVGTTPCNYTAWCKRANGKDKKAMKEAVRSFSLVQGQPVETEMKKLLELTIKKMQLPKEVRKSKEAEAAGLQGLSFNMFPAVFHLVAQLQRQRRPFGILFRSFGADHQKIQTEWNAFCELKHPIFSRLIEDLGPMDGSASGIPDRRIHSIHTLYRDAHGPMVMLDTFTNGPEDQPWDNWARSRPKPTNDSRNGKVWAKQVLKPRVVEGMMGFRKFCTDHLSKQATAAIKDDWAWWQFHSEQANAGKLMTLLRRKESAQVFFDDNIEPFDARIVDCRDEYDKTVADSIALEKYLVKVNPVEAMLDENYFWRKLLATQGDQVDVGASLFSVQKQLADAEEEKGALMKQNNRYCQQLKTLMEENRRMKQQRRIHVRDENDLHSILQKDGSDVKQFGTGRFKPLANLYAEIEHEACWLQENESGRIVRVLDIVYMMIKFQDMLLVESHEQDGTIIQTRNALPSTCMKIKDNLPDVLEEWFQSGLQVDIAPYIETEEMPVYVPDAPHQQSLLTEAYPIQCVVQQSQGSFVIPDTEVQVYKETFAKIGLPGGKSFSTTSKDTDGSSITRLWRWDKIKNWKAHATSGQKVASQIQDVSETCRKLFRDHPRAEIYQRLLLQMFEVFEAQKLTGGFSGSLVIRVQPFEADGRPGEPCIVKFDEGKAIRTEASNSKNVFKALPDRAARILGDAVYGRDKETQEEFGAMRLELAGACWNIPELAQGSSSLLSTFKDLLLYESEQMLLGSAGILKGDDMRPFGNVNSVLAETFGPGGIVSSLRKGGIGLHRNIDKPLISGWYTLKGKESKYNIFVAKKNEYAPEKEMRRLYREYFNTDVPNLKELIVHQIRPKLEELAKLETGSHLCPLVGLAHGDLNAANIMIDALDAVWLIDFATSIELPLFTDMCKFEMACLFEYATIPITPKMLLEFASTQETSWAELNVGDWLRTDQKTAELLLQRLVALPPDRLAGLSQNELEKVIDEVASKSAKAPHKQKALQRALLARLVSDQSFTDAAFTYAATISTALLQGDTIKDSLEIRNIQLPEGRGARGAASLRFFYENLVSIRRFMLHDVMGLLREQSKKGQLAAVDSLSLQLWLPFLRESYRVIGYRDIAPQYKVWCIFHCNLVARKVLSILETIQKHIRNLNKLQQTYSIRDAILGQSNNNDKVPTRRSDRHSTERAMQLTSHWVRSYSSLFPTVPASMRVVRKVHRSCPKYKEEPGFFAPVFQAQLPNGEKICKLSFYDLNDKGDADKAWELCLIDAKQMGNNGHTQSVKLGWVTGTKAEPEVVLSSRLVPLTDVFMRRKTEDLKDASSQEMKEILGSYLLQKWELSDKDVRAQSKTRPVQGVRNEEVDGFLCISVSVKDRGGSDILPLEIIVGAPCYCYPSGAMLCVDPQAEVPNWAQRSPCVVVQNLTESASSYVVRGSIPLTSQEGDGLAEFEPLPGNHTYLVPVKYPVSKPILFKQHGNEATWMEGQITQAPSAENQFCHVVKFLSGEKKDKEMPLHLDGMNSGIRVTNMTCSAYEEEVSKIKGHFRARHSWIMDSLSGLRFNVKECAPPTLSTVAFLGGTIKPESMTTSMSISKLMRRSASAVSFGGSYTGGTAEFKDAMEVKSGWQTVLSAVESYNLGQPSCNPNAFFVWGSPGSGKSCFVGRLMMEMLDRYENLIPLMLPVADLVKRSDPDGPDAVDAEGVQDWFDSYLRVTYGEDSLRYSMICQARSMSRVVFLFEGLEDAEKLSKAVESLIRVLVRAKNLVVVTSRPLLSRDRYSALENESELLVTMRLENLSDEQKRIVAYARLGAAGIEAYDNLLSRLRTSQNVSDQGTQGQGEETSNDGAEDVFGNPMMLSMLLCYLQTMGRRSEELEADEEKAEESEETTLTAVYRVAVDVMLQRVQSRTQGDRLLVQERVEQSKQILQKMAMAMQISRRFEIRVEEVDGMLKPELTEVWTALKTAVSAGHAMFLRMTGEAGPKEELRFLVKGFQNFFAASCIAAEGAAAEGLPDLKALLTEEHWQQMLEMLGEAWPGSYVEIVQNRLGQFKPTSKDNFLHLAARAGHRPIFQLLHKFPERHREELNQRGEEGMLPLHLAAQLGHTLLIELMLKAGSLINAEDANERLAVHIAMRNHHYSTAQFLNDRWLEIFGSAKSSERRSRKAEQLAQRMVSLNEKEFLSVASETFTELGFFSQKESVDKKRTVGALLAVFWIVADQYDQFVRGQEASNRLSKNSWEHLQDWTRNTVHLTKSHSMVSAMLVYVAIMNVGKIKPFRAAFAPEEDEPTEALARILHRSPILVPSFAKLEAEQQQIILRALKADFNFGQFLQAENLPASLFTVRQILQEGGEDGAGSGDILGFFLFRIFAAMCGVAGANSLDGSIFMTETNYKNFEVGLDTLMHLMEDGAVKVYDRFLEARARNQGLNFRMDGNRDQRALVRLACMMRAFDQAAGERIQAAWLRLEEDKRNKLVEFLNADGVKITPGFLLYHAPSFLDNAKKNEGNFPLEMIFEVLLQVYEAAAKEYAKSEQKVITVMVEALAEFAKNCKHTDVFQFVKFEIARTPGQKGEVMGNLVISPWQLVVDKHLLDGFENEAGKMFIELVPQTGLKENVYLKQHLPKIFPELGFFRDQDDHTKYLWRETLGRLLVIYWTATDQPEAFTRGQEIQKKLTENSWSKIREMTATSLESPEVFNAVLTAMAILDVAKLPKFRAQLAPHCASPTQVLSDVLENWPQVLPSFVRMPQEAQSLARDCLTSEFIFAEFIWAEIPPASVTKVKTMLTASRKSLSGLMDKTKYLGVFLYCVFIEMSASRSQSLEGSLYMTEDRWKEFEVGKNAILRLEEDSEQAVYDSILARSAQAAGFTFDGNKRESRALARLACMANITDPEKGRQLEESFNEMEEDQRVTLSTYLAADGINPNQKPAFAFQDGRLFLQKALANEQSVGPSAAILILLKVCQEVYEKYNDKSKSLLMVKLSRLATFAADFQGSVTFQDMPFALEMTSDGYALVIPKVWIPVSKEDVLKRLTLQCRTLAQNVMNGIGEKRFKTMLPKSFPELAYFGSSHAKQHDQTYGALLSVYWLVNDQHEAFTREQDQNDVLSKQSWAWIQDWMSEHLRLQFEEVLDSTMVFMAIHALGKIRQFREEVAPRYANSPELHDVALASILEETPEIVPSFNRLSAKYKSLIIDSLCVDFQFSQFLQAEIVPSNLVVVKEKLQQHGEEGYSLFCFRIFAQMSGKLGDKSLHGSLFMTESQFQKFRPGLEALMQLRNMDAGPAYNAFLLLRGSKALSRFASWQHQALVRLLCLSTAYDRDSGDAVCNAFDKLSNAERASLTRWLVADGISQRPGYVLCDAPELLKNAQGNPAVGLVEALKALVRVQEMMQAADLYILPSFGSGGPVKAYVQLRELALLAKEAGVSTQDFANVEMKVTADDHGEHRIYNVEVIRPEGLDKLYADETSRSGCRRCCNALLRCILLLFLLILFVVPGVAAAALYFEKKKVFHYMDKIPPKKAPEYSYKALDYVQDNPHLAMYVLIAVSLVSFLGILISCCCSGQRKHRPMGYDSITERVWCCAARTTSRMGRRDDARTACCSYQPLQQVESGAGEPLMPNASELVSR